MEVINDMRCNDRFYVREKLSNNQTLHMEFQIYQQSETTLQWNIALSVYSKRKHTNLNEASKKMTGKNPMESVFTAMKAFKTLEDTVLDRYCHFDNIIFCTWVDNRRRDAYYKYLSKKGYDWGVIDGFKCIMKKYPAAKEELE